MTHWPKCRALPHDVSLLEVLIGAAIAALVLLGLVATVDRLAASTASLDARLVAQADTARLLERLSSDAQSAWSVTAPSSDEIDFTAEDGSHRPYRWSYRFDPVAQTVTRSTGDVLGGIAGFDASAASLSDDPLFAGSTMPAEPATALTAVHVTGAGVDTTVMLASGTAPTSFTVVVSYTPSPTPLVTPTPTPLR